MTVMMFFGVHASFSVTDAVITECVLMRLMQMHFVEVVVHGRHVGPSIFV
jgi:hypothetical protein